MHHTSSPLPLPSTRRMSSLNICKQDSASPFGFTTTPNSDSRARSSSVCVLSTVAARTLALGGGENDALTRSQLCLQGFDEFMNVVLDDAEEVWIKETKTKKVGSRATLGAFRAGFVLVEKGESADRSV
jgi:hypothetical protein